MENKKQLWKLRGGGKMSVRIGPLIVLAVMSCIGLGIVIEKHGKPKKGKENAWLMFITWLIQWGLILWAIL